MRKIREIFRKKYCTITIGRDGTLFTFHKGKEIEKNVLFKEVKEAKEKVKDIFLNREDYPIYILLDHDDQIYKQKSYPNIKKRDVIRLAKKDITQEYQKSKNEIIKDILLKKKSGKKWNILLFLSELTKDVTEWIDFLVLSPKNRLVGIFLLPLEAKSSLSIIKKVAREKPSKSKNPTIDILTINSQVNGLRQFIFHENSLILTRNPDHNLEEENFVKYFEQDILRIIQYLKRSFPNIEVSNMNFINLLPLDFIKKIELLKSKSIKLINYNSALISDKIGISKNAKECEKIFIDNIISNNFIHNRRKTYKFSTAKIKKLNIFHIFTSILFFINISVIIFTGYILVKLFIDESKMKEEILNLKLEETSLQLELQNIRKKSLGNKSNEKKFYEIIDFGSVDSFFNNKENLYLTALNKSSVIPKDNNSIKYIIYSLDGFKTNNIRNRYTIAITGDIMNEGGDIDQLFDRFDKLILTVKSKIDNNKLKYSDIPSDINLNKKFYKYPFDITIESK